MISMVVIYVNEIEWGVSFMLLLLLLLLYELLITFLLCHIVGFNQDNRCIYVASLMYKGYP